MTHSKTFGDPLIFMQTTAKDLSIPLCFDYQEHSAAEFKQEGGFFYVGVLYANRSDLPSSNQFTVYLESRTAYNHNLPHGGVDPAFLKFLDATKNKKIIDFKRDSIADLGSYAQHTNICFDFYKLLNRRGDCENAYIHVDQPQDGTFMLEEIDYSEETGPEAIKRTQPYFTDVEKTAQPGDFRPYVHRMLELYAGISQHYWHEPSKYTPDPAEVLIAHSLTTLFTGEERETLERKLCAAKLQMKKGWASVPRLNLGNVQLPTPGQKDVRDDSYIVDGGMLLVEHLAALNVMSREEAEALIARRLEHYLLHKSGYQLSRGRAGTILNTLNETEGGIVHVNA